MILDLPTVPNEWHTIIVTVAVKEVATSNKIAINALTSSDLSNSFVFTEPLVSYVALDSGPFQAYLMAKYVVPWYSNSTLCDAVQLIWRDIAGSSRTQNLKCGRTCRSALDRSIP